jgi:CDP-glycerol glycerophosphotransferase
MKREFHIVQRLLTSACLRLLLQPFRLLPVKKNRVLFTSYLDKQYSCNPKYISEELMKMYPGRIEVGWAFRHPEEFSYLSEKGIRVLGTKTLKFIVFAMTARVICTNTYYKPSLPRRKKQFFLYTWHGGGAYKRVGDAQDMSLAERLSLRMREGRADLYLSSSRAFTRLTLRQSFGYRGEVMEKGMPRNDLLLSELDAEKTALIRRKIGLKDGERLCLYAPTYRKDTRVHKLSPDYEKTLSALEQRFSGTWVMGYRGHHVTQYKDHTDVNRGALDLTQYPDMQEILYAADALITDYSSSIWDMGLTGKPVFLYAPDLNSYRSERDFYTDIHTWPFPLAENMEQLEESIRSFHEDRYADAVRKHFRELGSCESGKASFFAARRIGYETGLEKKKYDDQ